MRFQSNILSRLNKIEKILATLGTSLAIGKSIKEATEFEAKMTTLSESLGSSISAFEKWQATVGRSLGFSKAQSAELANILSLNFKMFATSQQDLLEKTTKMMEVAAVVSNKRGMSMSEVSDRIRSAMNQEADGADELGVNVRKYAITASNAYKEMANGQPWDQLSTNMQKAILYHHILEQVSTNLGMTIQDTTAMRINVFSAALADLRLALGQAFTPIVHTILPALTALINKISKALSVVGQFMRVLFGIKGGSGGSKASGGFNASPSTIQDQAAAVNNLGKAVENAGRKMTKAAKAGKKAKKDMLGLAGFDELNTLDINKDTGSTSGAGSSSGGSAGGGSGSAGAAGMALTGFESDGKGVFGKVSDKVKKFAEKVRKFLQPAISWLKKAWNEVSEYVGEKIRDLVSFFKKYGPQILQALQNIWSVLKPIIGFLVEWLWNSIKGLIDGIIQAFKGFIKIFTGIFTGDWKLAWEGLKDLVVGILKAIWNFLNLTFIGAIRKGLVKMVGYFAKNFKNAWKYTKDAFKNVQGWFKTNVWDKITSPFKSAAAWFKNIGLKMWNGIKNAFVSVKNWFTSNVWNKITSAFSSAVSWFKNLGSKMWSNLKNGFTSIKDWFTKNVWNKITEAFSSAITWFKNLGSNMWANLKNGFTAVKDWFVNNVWAKIKSAFSPTWFTDLGKKLWSNLKSGFSAVKDWFVKNVWNKIKEPFVTAGNWFKDLGIKMWDKLTSPFKSAYKWFKEKVVDKISNAFKGINKSYQSIVSDTLKKALNAVIDKINAATGTINKIKNKIPGVNKIPNIPRIPKLAQGGYIGANRPTLAIIGDNRYEGEIVAPESKIYEQTFKAVRDALSSYGGGNQPIELIINLGSSRVFRKIIDGINREQRKAGKILLDI